MTGSPLRFGLSVALVSGLLAQTCIQVPAVAGAAESSKSRDEAAAKIEVITRLVLNVLVHDRGGNPVRGLSKADFEVTDAGRPQAISLFSVNQFPPAGQRAATTLPRNVVTNWPINHVDVPSSVTVVLVDSRFRAAMMSRNCEVSQVELPHNVGYLKIDAFPDPSVCRPLITKTMERLDKSSAIIFDLRENGGGSPEMVALVCSYLFDRRTHLTDMYDRAGNETWQSWTQSPIPGNHLADKPAYVLTSASTFSGAEEFTYDLKSLKRAIIVGEQTGGGAHFGSPHAINEYFTVSIPSGRPINPITKTDWEGTGVEPDVKVPASEALEKTEKLVLKSSPRVYGSKK